MIDTLLFDLDGTLLPMDQEVFTRAYFHGLAKKLAPHGYEAKTLVDAVWTGTAAMVKNDGSRTNEEAFWKRFLEIYGERARADEPLFLDFYRNEFQSVASVCGMNPAAAETVALAKSLGLRVALATNPLFPAIATESRIRWAGLRPESFEYYTTYENSTRCKPNPAYYLDVAEALGVAPESCLMVGNDTGEDMIAESIGMRVFLLTDCLICREGDDLNRWSHGGFEQLQHFIRGLNA